MINLYCIRPKGFNIGNDVIFLALNHFIRNAFKETVNIISLPATGKYEAQKKSGLTPQTIYEINQYGRGLIIGGGNLYENGELEINPVALKALEVPLMLFSLSRGRIYNRNLDMVDRTDVMSDEKIIMLNKKATLSLSRDLATKRYIDSLGCNNIAGGCPTLFINEIPQHLIPLSEESKTDALISIRTSTLMSIPVYYQFKVRDDIVKIIDYLKSRRYKNIKFLCHDHRDIPFAASFLDVDYFYTEDVYTYLTFLKNTRLNITYRLHSFLPCLSFDIPAIKISYDERALSMLETIGMGEWNINMLKMNVIEEVISRINSLDRLNKLKEEYKLSIWKQFRETIINNFNIFALKVNNLNT
jgi:hypothetical protein